MQRPVPAVAATTAALTLMQCYDLTVLWQEAAASRLIEKLLKPLQTNDAQLAAVIGVYAAETILGARQLLSRAEMQLRRLFLTRTSADEIGTAVHAYFSIDDADKVDIVPLIDIRDD